MTSKVPPKGETIPGIDVSAFQTNTDWAQVSRQGIRFTFIKATDGINWVNHCFEHDIVYTKINSILRGAYHFFRPDKAGRAQAEHFLSVIEQYDLDLPPVLDWEPTDGDWSPAIQVQGALRWLDIVGNRTGRVPIIYSSPAFINSMGNPQALAKYPLWIANYGVEVPNIPLPWDDWKFWQHNQYGNVPGVSTINVDLDMFNGSMDDLVAMTKP